MSCGDDGAGVFLFLLMERRSHQSPEEFVQTAKIIIDNLDGRIRGALGHKIDQIELYNGDSGERIALNAEKFFEYLMENNLKVEIKKEVMEFPTVKALQKRICEKAMKVKK